MKINTDPAILNGSGSDENIRLRKKMPYCFLSRNAENPDPVVFGFMNPDPMKNFDFERRIVSFSVNQLIVFSSLKNSFLRFRAVLRIIRLWIHSFILVGCNKLIVRLDQHVKKVHHQSENEAIAKVSF